MEEVKSSLQSESTERPVRQECLPHSAHILQHHTPQAEQQIAVSHTSSTIRKQHTV